MGIIFLELTRTIMEYILWINYGYEWRWKTECKDINELKNEILKANYEFIITKKVNVNIEF